MPSSFLYQLERRGDIVPKLDRPERRYARRLWRRRDGRIACLAYRLVSERGLRIDKAVETAKQMVEQPHLFASEPAFIPGSRVNKEEQT